MQLCATNWHVATHASTAVTWPSGGSADGKDNDGGRECFNAKQNLTRDGGCGGRRQQASGSWQADALAHTRFPGDAIGGFDFVPHTLSAGLAPVASGEARTANGARTGLTAAQ